MTDVGAILQTAARTCHPSALHCIIASNEFGSYCIPQASLHRPVAQTILRADVWEPETIAFMRGNSGIGDIVHAGTYFGDFLPGLSSGLGIDALVWAFEPNEENVRCARITIELNALHRNVRLVHAALGPKEGTVMLSVIDDSSRSLGGASHVSDGGTERTRQVALDDIVPTNRRVTILQLDVEGSEAMALQGAEELIRRDKPILILETVPTNEWFNQLLSDCHYKFAQKVEANSAFIA